MKRTFAEQNKSGTVVERFAETDVGFLQEAFMLNLKEIQNELHHARQARLDAQQAGTDVEEMIWQVQHFEPGKQRMVFIFECGEDELAKLPH
jgi:hypothetical protein